MSIIKNEMLRGPCSNPIVSVAQRLPSAMQITDKIMSQPGSSWVELFETVDFFGMYKTYVQVVASASTSEGIKDW